MKFFLRIVLLQMQAFRIVRNYKFKNLVLILTGLALKSTYNRFNATNKGLTNLHARILNLVNGIMR
jgi:hypothetical protein